MMADTTISMELCRERMDSLDRRTNERIDAMDGRIDNLDHQLNGDARPGIVDQIETIVAYVNRQNGKEEAFAEARQRAKDTRKLIIWILGIILSAVGTLAGWGAVHLWNVVEPPAAAIIEEYWKNHPQAVERQKGIMHSTFDSTLAHQAPHTLSEVYDYAP